MATDPTSPIAPAKVLLLLLPIGRIKSGRFAGFVERLRAHTTVRLGDITPDSSSASFSPLAFPNGIILYNVATALPPHSHVALSPFETFREPLIVLGICDADEYEQSQVAQTDAPSSIEADLRDGLNDIHERCPRALVVRTLLFDSSSPESPANLSQDVVVVSIPERPTTMKTIMADISSLFLTELSTLARTIQTTPPPDLLYNAAHGLSTTDFPVAERAAVPFRSSSLRTEIARDSSPVPSTENGEFDSHEGSVTSSPALSTMNSCQNIRSPNIQDAADMSSLSGANTHRTSAETESNGTDIAQTRAASRNPDLYPAQEQKRKNRNSTAMSSDFANSRLKARQAIIIGSLYLHAGRWPDAMRELVDGANRAKVYNDHLWHGKALENLLITMLLLAWGGFEFQIPQVCSAIPTRLTQVKRNSVTSVSFADIRPSSDPSRNESLNNLCTAIPDLTQMIVTTYSRAANAQGEVPFQFAFSESVIRLGKLVSILHISQNVLDRKTLEALVQDTAIFEDESQPSVADTGFKAQLAVFLTKGYPMKSTTLGLSSSDSVIILSGVASVYSLANMKRNQAMANRQLLLVLISALTHAKKMKMAETEYQLQPQTSTAFGHSVASPALHSSSELGNLQQALCWQYGIFDHNVYTSNISTNSGSSAVSGDEQISSHIVNDSIWRSLGSRDMKKDVLRLCADLSELMEDPQATMDYLAALFCALRPSINPSTGAISVRHRTSREEQLDLAAQMHRALEGMIAKGTLIPATAYWDPYLVSSIEVQEAETHVKLFAFEYSGHASNGKDTHGSGPFLHDAFSKSAKEKTQSRVLVAGETAEFVVTLRNLFEFEAVIENLSLITTGVVVEHNPVTITLGAFRRQKILFSGVPVSSGELVIRGCKIQVRGCRQQEFLVFPTPWQPMIEIKNKHNGLGIPVPVSDGKPAHDTLGVGPMPQPIDTIFSVAKQQPVLKISSTSLSQNMVSILHGQNYPFIINVQNISENVSINFLHVSFLYKTHHDISVQVLHPPFTWKKTDMTEEVYIRPGHSFVLAIDVLGVPTLSECSIVIDYAHLEKPVYEMEGSFLTRRVFFPLTVTVNPSIELFQVDVVPFDRSKFHEMHSSVLKTESAHASKLKEESFDEVEVVLLLLDLRNSWLRPLSVTVHARALVGRDAMSTASEVIQPGHVGRLVVLMPRTIWEDFAEPTKEDVGKSTRVSPPPKNYQERSATQCREAILKGLDAFWQELGRADRGSVDLYPMQLSARMIDLIRKNPVEIHVRVFRIGDRGSTEIMPCRDVFPARVDERLTLVVELRNQTANDLHVHVQLQLKVGQAMVDPQVDLSTRLAWSGNLRRRFVRLRATGTSEYAVGLCYLAAGCYEVAVEVVEASHPQEHNQSHNTSLSKEWQRVASTAAINITEP